MAKISSSRVNDAIGRSLGQVRDFRHASFAYVADPGYTNAPKLGFLFHVRFMFTQVGAADPVTLGVLVKSVDLPKFNIDVDVLNKYNKKEIVQKRIIYEPVTLTMHDDGKNSVRNMWLAYNQFYFADSNITQQAYLLEDTYSPVRLETRYGLDNGQQGRFLQGVEIYSMHNHRYAKYTLVNPMISSFDFDSHDYAEGSKVMQAIMRLEYENVLYAEGATEAIPGFGRSSKFYDNRFSDLKPGIITPPVTNKAYNPVETSNVTRKVIPPVPTTDLPTVPPIKITTAQQKQIKVNAANSLQRNKKFSFPTASEINNLSALVDINAQLRPKQGIVNKSNQVTSNGATIATSANSSVGAYTIDNEIYNAILITPRIPQGLTAGERSTFLASYPPLPSTDPRTREAPYV